MDVTVLTSVSKLSELKSDWHAILEENQEDNFYYSFDWIHAACRLFIHPVSQPFIVWIREDNKPVASIEDDCGLFPITDWSLSAISTRLIAGALF